MNRRLPAALALLALIGAGCSDGATTDGDSKRATDQSTGTKFAQCMRDNGVSEFPDPDASGELTIDGIVNGSSLDPDAPAWKRAIAACKDLQPAGFTGHKRNAEEQTAGLRFAACMRENGVEDFPDPAPGEPLVNTYRIPSSSRPGGMDALNAAMRKCRGAAADAGASP